MRRNHTRRFRLTLISFLAPILLTVFSVPALAEVVGRLNRVEGAVDIMPGGKLPAVAARQGSQVQKGDFVRTKSNSRAELTFNDGSVLKIAQRSRIDVSEYSASDRKLALPRGKVQATVVPVAGGRSRTFEIKTPNAIAGVRGTSFYVYHQGNVTGVTVLEGVVQTASLAVPSKPVTLVAGTATTVTKQKAPTPARPVTEKEMRSHESDVTPTTQGGGDTSAPSGEGEAASGSAGSDGSASSTGADSGGSAESGSAGETEAAAGTETSSTTETAAAGETSGSGSGETTAAGDTSTSGSGESTSTATTSDAGSGTASASGTGSATTSDSTGTAGATTPAATTSSTAAATTTTSPGTPTTSTAGSYSTGLNTAAFSEPTTISTALNPIAQTSAPTAPSQTASATPTTQVVIPVTDASPDAEEAIAPPTDPGTTDPGTTDPVTTDPGTTDPGTTDPVTTDPGTTDPGTTDPGTTDPPLFTSQLAGGLMSRDATIDTNSNLLTIISDPGFAPVLSGTTSLWSGGSVQASLSGVYPTLPLQQPNHYWFGKFFSESTPTHTTADGGAYFGYFGGMSLDATGILAADLSAIYIDPTGKAGIMQGSIPGTITAGTVSGTGTLTLTEMNPVSNINPVAFPANWWSDATILVEMTGPVLTGSETPGNKNEAEGFLLDAAFNFTSFMESRGDVLRLGYLASDPSFGIWSRESFGSYDGTDTAGSQFALISNADWGTVDTSNMFTLDDAIQVVSIGNWQEGALTGKADGIWGNLATGSVRLLTGDLTGSANPGTMTFGAVSTGSFIDVNRFIGNPTLAAGLGFPTLLGNDSFTLSGASGTGTVNLGTLNFYSRTVGDPVSVWVTENVTGTYSGTLQFQNYSLMNSASPSTSSIMGNMRIIGTSGTNWIGSLQAIGETGTSFRNEFDGIAAGSFDGTSFTGVAAGLAHPVTYYSSLSGELKRFDADLVAPYANVDGVMGGMSLWGSTPVLPSEYQAVGFVTPTRTMNVTDFVLSMPVRSQDLPGGVAMTSDGGAYQGTLVAGVNTTGGPGTSPSIFGYLDALSIDPSGNAGITKGWVEGYLEPSSNIWKMDGDLIPVAIEAATTVTASTLNGAAGVITDTITFGSGTQFNSFELGLSGLATDSYVGSHIASSPGWGIGHFGLFAPYSTSPAAGTPWGIDFTITDGSIANFEMRGFMDGHLWDTTTGQLQAGTVAVWRDMLPAQGTPTTGIYIGETVGTFNPSSLQAMTSGIWFETGKFLNLAMNDPAILHNLKIPAFEVGRASFSGGNSDFDVTVNDLVFFSPLSGGRPEIFATNGITGTNNVASVIGMATLTQTSGTGVSGFSPTFAINRWDTVDNKWAGTIEFTGSTGTVAGHGNVQFMGVAAGTMNGGVPGTFTGTAAGIAR